MSLRYTATNMLAATATVLALTLPAAAQTIELKVSHFLPPNHTFHKAMIAWGKLLKKDAFSKASAWG